MKPMKLTSLVMMLLIAFSAAAQEEFFDDVYFSSKNKKKKEQVVEKKVVQPKQESRTLVATAKSQASSDSRDVDEYNRRYTSVDVEEPYDEDSDGEVLAEYNDDMDNEKTVASDSKKERRSDTEYTERIIRYHSPSKITIAGADQVDLYLSDGYYAYGYDTDYSNGSTNVSVNVNIGNGCSGCAVFQHQITNGKARLVELIHVQAYFLGVFCIHFHHFCSLDDLHRPFHLILDSKRSGRHGIANSEMLVFHVQLEAALHDRGRTRENGSHPGK